MFLIITSIYHFPTVVEAGDDVSKCLNNVTLLLPNHQSPVDIFVMSSTLTNKNNLRRGIMWVIYKTFKWTHFGVSCQIRQDFFIEQVSFFNKINMHG